jgi:GNAT superfamily N-acetyltransferase
VTPPLFFSVVPADDGEPGQVDVEAHLSGPALAGDMVYTRAPASLGIVPQDRVGALRWHVLTGDVTEVYVPPPWRRQGIATALLRRCQKFASGTGFAYPQVTGARTALGHVWLCALGDDAFPPAWAMPMTPPQDTEGMERRLLIPDDPDVLTARVRQVCPPDVSTEDLADVMDLTCGPALGVRLSDYERQS